MKGWRYNWRVRAFVAIAAAVAIVWVSMPAADASTAVVPGPITDLHGWTPYGYMLKMDTSVNTNLTGECNVEIMVPAGSQGTTTETDEDFYSCSGVILADWYNPTGCGGGGCYQAYNGTAVVKVSTTSGWCGPAIPTCASRTSSPCSTTAGYGGWQPLDSSPGGYCCDGSGHLWEDLSTLQCNSGATQTSSFVGWIDASGYGHSACTDQYDNYSSLQGWTATANGASQATVTVNAVLIGAGYSCATSGPYAGRTCASVQFSGWNVWFPGRSALASGCGGGCNGFQNKWIPTYSERGGCGGLAYSTDLQGSCSVTSHLAAPPQTVTVTGATCSGCPTTNLEAVTGQFGVGDITWAANQSAVPGSLPTPQWYQGGQAGAGAPCQLLTISGQDPNMTYTSGTQYTYQITYTKGLVSMSVDPFDGGTPPGSASAGDATVTVLNGVSIGNNEYQAVVNMTPTATGQWDPDFTGTCSDGSNYFYGDYFGLVGTGTAGSDGGNGVTCQAGQGTFPVGCSQDLSGCLANAGSGLSLYNPASWIGAGLDGLACIIGWAFVPASISTSALVNPVTSHAPYTYVADAVNAGTTMVGGVNSSLAGSVCDAPRIAAPFGGLSHVGGVSSFGMTLPVSATLGCSDPGSGYASSGHSVGDLFGFRVLIRDLLTLAVWAGTAYTALRMMPFTDGIAPRVIARGAGLNLDGEYVDTAWMNEGSG